MTCENCKHWCVTAIDPELGFCPQLGVTTLNREHCCGWRKKEDCK